MNPRAKKNARAISHGISLAMALKAWAKVRVWVRMQTPRPRRATAPRGRGPVMMPMMVLRKMARRCQALGFTPSGTGIRKITTPTATVMASSFGLAPFQTYPGLAAPPSTLTARYPGPVPASFCPSDPDMCVGARS